MTFGALWQSAAHGEVHDTVVAALRQCLDRLPAQDHPLRCRRCSAWPDELYYGSDAAERAELVEQGLEMARRLGDDEIDDVRSMAASSALWEPKPRPRRLALAEAARARPRPATSGVDHRDHAGAVAHGELGQLPQMWEQAAVAREWPSGMRLPYGAAGRGDAGAALAGDGGPVRGGRTGTSRTWQALREQMELTEGRGVGRGAAVPAPVAGPRRGGAAADEVPGGWPLPVTTLSASISCAPATRRRGRGGPRRARRRSHLGQLVLAAQLGGGARRSESPSASPKLPRGSTT